MQFYWFVALISAICLEGLGRKYLPSIPSAVFYFLKDVVLVVGYFVLRPPLEVRRAVRWLFRGFTAVLVVAIAWTVVEIMNPAVASMTLGLIGIRAYWLWMLLAPVTVATALRGTRFKHRAIYALLVLAVGISVLASVQFASSPTSAVNLYSTVDGEEVYADRATVSATGRARVSSTFSFLSGFTAFTLLVPTLLLSVGLEAKKPMLRRSCLVVTLVCASVVPMSGSRGAVILGALVLSLTVWAAGLLFTSIGRRVLLGAIVAAVLATAAFPEAFEGVESRFANEDETATRFEDALVILPPVALATFDYPFMGIGTGMQQNVRGSMNITTEYGAENEVGRYLIELGPIGFLLVWTTRLGIVIALLRAYSFLKKRGRRGAAGAALSYSVLSMLGNLIFDHIFQALFFMGCGFIVAEVVEVWEAASLAPPAPVPVAVDR